MNCFNKGLKMKSINKNKVTTSVLTCLAASVLVACGGGGGGSTPSVPISNTCANGATDYPKCTPPVIPAKLQAATAPTYTIDSRQYSMFTSLNLFRSRVGLGPINQNAALDKAAANHQNYLDVSFKSGDASGHIEVEGRAGFTGVLPINRAVFAGYSNPGLVGENMMADAANGVEFLLTGIYHRQGFMIEGLTDVGISSSDLKGTIFDFGYVTAQTNASNFVGVYPADKQTGIGLVHGLETPNPFEFEMTAANLCTKTSYPISIQSQSSTQLSVTSFSVREFGSSSDLPATIFYPSQKDIYKNNSFLVGSQPFKPFTTYEVHFVGKVSGGLSDTGFIVDKTWSFTTGPKWSLCTNIGL